MFLSAAVSLVIQETLLVPNQIVSWENNIKTDQSLYLYEKH